MHQRRSFNRNASDKGRKSAPKEEIDTATTIQRLRQDKGRKILAFVNEKSGGQIGGQVHELFSKIIDSEYKGKVFNINKYPPKDIFRDYKEFLEDTDYDLRMLVCGGDGTVTWILTAFQDAGIQRKIPTGILPLGTGNDLSIAFKWGGAFNPHILQNEKIAYAFIEDLFHAEVTYLDSWSLVMKWPESMDSQVDRNHFPKGSEVDDDRRIMFKQCFNYLSIGQDAHSCYNFDMVREQRPELFIHPNVNKLCYGVQSVQTGWLFGVSALTSINRKIQLLIHDAKTDKMVDITKNMDNSMMGIIILNLPNYAGGKDLWQIKEKAKVGFQPQDPQDQLLEIAAYRSTSDFALAALGIKPAARLAQTKSIHINIRGINIKEQKKYPETFLQVDGEPWKLPVPVNNTRSTPKMYKSMLRLREKKQGEEDIDQITLDITYNRNFPMLKHKEMEQKQSIPCMPRRPSAKKRRSQTWQEAVYQDVREEQQGEVIRPVKLGSVEEEVQQQQPFSTEQSQELNQPSVKQDDHVKGDTGQQGGKNIEGGQNSVGEEDKFGDAQSGLKQSEQIFQQTDNGSKKSNNQLSNKSGQTEFFSMKSNNTEGQTLKQDSQQVTTSN